MLGKINIAKNVLISWFSQGVPLSAVMHTLPVYACICLHYMLNFFAVKLCRKAVVVKIH